MTKNAILVLFAFAVAAGALFAETNKTNARGTTGPNTSKEALETYRATFRYGTPAEKNELIARIRQPNDGGIPIIVERYPKERNKSVKLAILNLFKRVVTKQALPVARAALKDKDEEILRNAYALVALYPEKEFETALLAALPAEKNARVKDSIISALGDMKSENAAPLLIEMYTKDREDDTLDDLTRTAIVEALGKIGAKEAQAILHQVIDDSAMNAAARYVAIVSLGAYPTMENYEIIKRLIASDDPEIAARATYTLPKFKSVANIEDDLFAAATSDNDRTRLYALQALKDYPGKATKELLLFRIERESAASIVLAIIAALSSYDDNDVIEKLRYQAEHGATMPIKNAAREILEKKGVTLPEKK